MTITPAILNDHIETDRIDAVLQRLIDDANADIVARYGSNTTRTKQWVLIAPTRRIWLDHAITSLTTVKEGATVDNLTTLTVTTDYLLVSSNWVVERIGAEWQKHIELTYVPRNDEKRRDRVTIDLCKLALNYDALQSERVGDFASVHLDYQKEREAILSGLNGGQRIIG